MTVDQQQALILLVANWRAEAAKLQYNKDELMPGAGLLIAADDLERVLLAWEGRVLH